MSNTLVMILFGAATVFFGLPLLRIVPTVARLLGALISGAVTWPGPRVHDPGRSASSVRLGLGVGYENLYSTFIFHAMATSAAFVFSLLTFLSTTSGLSDLVRIEWTAMVVCLTLLALVGGGLGAGKALRYRVQVRATLSDRAADVEPRAVGGRSAESEYSIEHPLLGHRRLSPDGKRALDLFYESVRCHQDGNEYRALTLVQEATKIDPSLHQNAREMLADMAQDCSPEDAGAIYYWLGIHSKYSTDFRQAADWYQKASEVYTQMGYDNRASRARCNLGSVKMRLGDPTAMEDFEAAIALNPRNGTAHLNIASTYYGFCNPGDPRFERALDAFADAIVADPVTYGPRVISNMRKLGYTWKEDLDEVTRRSEAKMDRLSEEQTAG